MAKSLSRAAGSVAAAVKGDRTSMRLPSTASLRLCHASAEGQAASVGRTRPSTRDAVGAVSAAQLLMSTKDPAAAVFRNVRRFTATKLPATVQRVKAPA